MIVIRLSRRILKLQALMADMPQISVAAVAGISGKRKIDAMGFAVVDFLLTGLHGPNVGHTPGSDDFQIWSQSLDSKLKADLIVAFSCSAVADCAGSLLAGNFYQLFGNAGAGHGSSKQIFIFIDSSRLHAGNNVVIAEIVYDIFNIKL